MRKSFFASLVVVLTILTSAVPASARDYFPTSPDGWWYKIQGNQVMMLEADNLEMINQIQRQGYRSLGSSLRWNGSAYGLPMGGGGFYPMYDRQMQPMGRREATVTGAAIGAGIGYGVSGNAQVTAIGAGVGALIGLATHRGNSNNRNDKNVVVTPPSQGQGVYVGSDGISVAVGMRSNAGSASRPPTRGEWRITNRTSKRVDLYDGKEFIRRLEPWQSVEVPTPQVGYGAVLLLPNRSGGLDNEDARIRRNDNFNGWDIVAPAVQ